jgi:hypothetical protein
MVRQYILDNGDDEEVKFKLRIKTDDLIVNARLP